MPITKPDLDSESEPFNTNIMLHQIIESNNNGIKFLEAGSDELAKESFKVALEQITEILSLFKDHVHDIECQGLAPNVPIPSIVHVPISESTRGEISSKGSYIYRYALTLEFDTELRGVDQGALVYQCSSPLAIVIMFNLGFVHHYRNQEQQHPFLLSKALCLYEMAWSLWQRSHYCKDYMSSSSTAKADPYIMGILNNMGAIYHELGQYDQAHTCFGLLKSLLHRGAGGVHEQEADHYGIMMNVMFLEKPYLAPAA